MASILAGHEQCGKWLDCALEEVGLLAVVVMASAVISGRFFAAGIDGMGICYTNPAPAVVHFINAKHACEKVASLPVP